MYPELVIAVTVVRGCPPLRSAAWLVPWIDRSQGVASVRAWGYGWPYVRSSRVRVRFDEGLFVVSSVCVWCGNAFIVVVALETCEISEGIDGLGGECEGVSVSYWSGGRLMAPD